MNIELKKIAIVLAFILVIVLGIIGWSWSEDVRVLSMRGPLATTTISPSSVTATAYRMNIAGQKVINFKNNANIVVYLASSTSAGNNGWPLLFKGDSISIDLKSGTTVYLKAAAENADIRVIISR